MRIHSKFTKYLSIVNIFGIGITIFSCFYLLILFPSILNPYGEIAIENAEQYTNPTDLEQLFKEIENWVEASNNRSEFLVATMLTFLLLMLAIFSINLSFVRRLEKELSRHNNKK
jgi:hypothetical protein